MLRSSPCAQRVDSIAAAAQSRFWVAWRVPPVLGLGHPHEGSRSARAATRSVRRIVRTVEGCGLTRCSLQGSQGILDRQTLGFSTHYILNDLRRAARPEATRRIGTP